ncbi:MAG: Coenzyme synthetase-like protein, partial [Cyanobacteria bacterium RYN_339]|nr:Coenzyme synthetase-like protein [Cyanobacteria bacterium RYN_339]
GDVWHRRPGTQGFTRALPRGVVLHVASGNVATTGVLSLVEGLLAKNVNILKVASNAPSLPLLFAQSIADHDPEGVIARSFAILSWSGEREALHEVFCREADAVVVWGGDEVLETYRRALGPHTRLIPWGPKVSAGFLGAEALTAETATAVARDIALWDQNACSSPQVQYVEGDAAAFVELLALALERLAHELPMGTLDLHERAEITKERELALADQLMGLGRLIRPAGPEWTIIVDPDPAFRLSPLFRTIIVKPVARLEDALPHLAPYRHYFQTAALAVGAERVGELAERLALAGALRVTRVGETSGGTPGEPHDGVFALDELVRWVALDAPGAAEAFDGSGWMAADRVEAIARAKRRRLVDTWLPRSPYYREALRGHDADDWLALPILDKATLIAHTPPQGQGLLTEVPQGGHWLRSGGSTGAPKLSIYSFEDYEEDMLRAARGAHAAGLRPGQKVANLFYSGELYGSYLSLNRALELIGCNAFSFTQVASAEAVIACMREFGIDTLIGLSSHLQAILAQTDLPIRHVLYAGEPFPAQARGNYKVSSIGYGGVDAGPMGFQCAHCVGDQHHLHADHVYLEILDPETWQPADEGEVVITSLNRRLMPLLRYRVGDRARWVPGACPCGLASPRFELLGRSDDKVRLEGCDFHLADVARVTAAIAGLHPVPQVELAGTVARPEVTVRAQTEALGDVAALGAELRAALLALEPDFAAVGLVVEVLPPGALAQGSRTGKITRLVDRRGGR